jgi:hypothetical protein
MEIIQDLHSIFEQAKTIQPGNYNAMNYIAGELRRAADHWQRWAQFAEADEYARAEQSARQHELNRMRATITPVHRVSGAFLPGAEPAPALPPTAVTDSPQLTGADSDDK